MTGLVALHVVVLVVLGRPEVEVKAKQAFGLRVGTFRTVTELRFQELFNGR
jgi:hypothetical protein